MLGYTTGIRRCLEDRDSTIQSLIAGVLSRQAHGADILSRTAKASLTVQRIGQELLVAAQAHLTEEIQREPADNVDDDPRAAKLRALQRLDWQFLVIDNESSNAFVADTLPGFVFVHRGLVELMNEDELAFVIGHELSHFICDHSTSHQGLQGAFSILQIVVLASVDPTGIISLLLELPIASSLFSVAVQLPLSRQHENEADVLGLMLTARACREPLRALKAHEQLAAIEARHGQGTETTSIVATHPAFDERIAALKTRLPEAQALYEISGCDRIKSALKRVGFLKG